MGSDSAGTRTDTLCRSLVPSTLKLGLTPALRFSAPTVARVFVRECATPAATTPLMLIIEYTPDATVTPGGPTAVTAVVITARDVCIGV